MFIFQPNTSPRSNTKLVAPPAPSFGATWAWIGHGLAQGGNSCPEPRDRQIAPAGLGAVADFFGELRRRRGDREVCRAIAGRNRPRGTSDHEADSEQDGRSNSGRGEASFHALLLRAEHPCRTHDVAINPRRLHVCHERQLTDSRIKSCVASLVPRREANCGPIIGPAAGPCRKAATDPAIVSQSVSYGVTANAVHRPRRFVKFAQL